MLHSPPRHARAGTPKTCKERQEAAARGCRVRVAMEATGHYWMALYQRLNDDGYGVLVFNPMQTHAFTSTSIRGVKSDRVDARRIAHLLRQEQLPATTRPDEDLTLPAIIAVLDVSRLTDLLFQASRRHLGREKAEQVQAAARTSFGLRMAHDVLAQEVRLLVQGIGFIEAKIKQLDGQVRGILAAQQEQLATIPGIGPVVAATILAELGDVTRFAGAKDPAKAVVALAGIDPKPADSGQRAVYRRMSKRGSPYLRQAFYQAAFAAWQHDAMLGALYRKKLAEGKPHRVALNAVANKLCHVVYACLRDRRRYEVRDPVPELGEPGSPPVHGSALCEASGNGLSASSALFAGSHSTIPLLGMNRDLSASESRSRSIPTLHSCVIGDERRSKCVIRANVHRNTLAQGR